MKPIKVVHFADLHYSAEHREPALKSLDFLIDYCERENPDLIVTAGDLFDHGIQNSERGGLPDLIARFKRLRRVAPVLGLYGTPTHDVPGCYESLEAAGTITMIDPRTWSPPVMWLCEDGSTEVEIWSEENPVSDGHTARLMILGCPEPSKEWFLADKKGLGRDEANQAVVDGMRSLLLGLGALRKQYAHLPCLMVYHGQVAGSSLANGQTLRPGGIQIGKDDLRLVDPEILSWYSGSCAPWTWGETDQKCFNVISFSGNETYGALGDIHLGQQVTAPDGPVAMAVDRIPFPHPPRKKIVCLIGDGADIDCDGFQTWLEVKGSKEELSGFVAEKQLDEMILAGALPGSRVTTTVIPTETVRAKGMELAITLKEKLEVYAENSEQKLTKPIVEKGYQLESEARRQGLTSDGLHIRIKSLRLRGAIGIQRGQGKDEIELDLDAYDPGLVALIGANGEGKTTLIENMHPYSQMLTRDGKLQDHFGLRDSYRDLLFVDERTGDEYRSLMQIDGANKSGAVDYHLYRNGEPLVNGRKADYDEQIEKLFGSLSLYLRSAFVSQRPTKGNPDLSAATQGEKKSLFRELAGLEYLQAYSEQAREKAKAIETETERDKGKIDALTESVENAPDLESRKAELDGAVGDLQSVVDGLIEEGKKLKAESEAASKAAEEQRAIVKTMQDKDAQIRAKREEIASAEREIEEHHRTRERLPQAELAISNHERLKKEEDELNEGYRKYLEARDSERNERENRTAAVRAAERALLDNQSKFDKAISELGTQKAIAEQSIASFVKSLAEPLDENCPTCGQLLPEYTRAKLEAARRSVENDLETARNALSEHERDIKGFEAAKADLQRQIEALEWPLPTEDRPFEHADRLAEIKVELADIDLAAARKIVEDSATARTKIEGLQTRIHDAEMSIEVLATEIHDLQLKLDTSIEANASELALKLERKRKEYETQSGLIAEMRADLRHVEGQISELTEKRNQLEALRTALEGKLTDAREWRWLETACGPNGIQALELDALAPSIADVANRLLDAAYGARFSIEFRTMRMGGNGSRAHQIEDFRIVVHCDGSEQELDTLSGGESVWIRKAIYGAFGIVRARNTGTQFLTRFVDEADGALDPEAKLAYFRMLEAEHVEGGAVHTLLISHSDAIQEMIAQKIVMRELGALEKVEV